MKPIILLSALLGMAAAHPFVGMGNLGKRNAEPAAAFGFGGHEEGFGQDIDTLMAEIDTRDSPGIAISKAEKNCGPNDCLGFNENQEIDITGQHAYASPAADEIRGPCPGLNAAANHAYIPRSGILHITDAIIGLEQVYALGGEFTAFLTVFAITIVGDMATMSWSIGGPQPYPDLGGTLTPPQGIAYSHNKYEGDVSIGRNDAYMNQGDAHSLNLTRFKRAFETGMDNNRYTLHKFRKAFLANVQWSIRNNPYYFSPPFAGTLVAPAAYNFAVNFMSNRTKSNPNGYFDAYNFQTFFAVKGKYPNFKWAKGQERIPNNWYRRPLGNPYDAARTAEDDAIGWAAYPEGFRIGGNLNGKNSYAGADLSALTGGTLNAKNILKGNNAACLAFQAAQQGLPDELKGGINNVAQATKLVKKVNAPILKKLNCQPLAHYDSSVFNKYPGRHYSPTGPATNY